MPPFNGAHAPAARLRSRPLKLLCPHLLKPGILTVWELGCYVLRNLSLRDERKPRWIARDFATAPLLAKEQNIGADLRLCHIANARNEIVSIELKRWCFHVEIKKLPRAHGKRSPYPQT
jgi:hypothetical protein